MWSMHVRERVWAEPPSGPPRWTNTVLTNPFPQALEALISSSTSYKRTGRWKRFNRSLKAIRGFT